MISLLLNIDFIILKDKFGIIAIPDKNIASFIAPNIKPPMDNVSDTTIIGTSNPNIGYDLIMG